MFSIYAYIFNERPIILFIKGLSYNLIPSLLFLLGADTAKKSDATIFKRILVSNIIIMLFGFVVILFPSFEDSLGQENLAITDFGFRFGSYLTSLPLGSTIASSIPILFMVAKKFKKPLVIIFAVVIIISLILTMQRGAWIAGIISFLLSLILKVRNSRHKILTSFGILIMIIFLITIFYFIYDIYFPDNLKLLLDRRLEDLDSSMFTSRTDQWESAFDMFLKYPLGFGLGAAGNKASTYGLQIIPDGNYFRILLEIGIIGFISFLFLNIKTMILAIQKHQLYLAILLLSFLMHAVGTNVFDFYYSSFIYWFILGYITYCDNKSKIHKEVYNKC
jgi:O-antigen ligase